jgi:hypothetical protein
MKETIQKRLSDSKTARWTALFIVSFTMMCGYFLTDVMSPLENLLTTKGQVVYFTDDTSMPADSLVAKVNYFSSEEMLSNSLLTVEQLEEGSKVQYYEMQNGAQTQTEKTISSVARGEGWSSTEYGFFSGAYGLINVFLLMLFFGGVILDKMGIRFTGMMSSGLMFMGALIKWYALSSDFGDAQLFGMDMQVALASLGFAIFGMGAEITGITASKVIVKWFAVKECLAKSKYPDGFEFDFYTTSQTQKQAELLKSMVDASGSITMNLVEVPDSDIFSYMFGYKTKDNGERYYNAVGTYMMSDFLDPMGMLKTLYAGSNACEGGTNETLWSSTEADGLLAKAAQTTDDAEKMGYYTDAYKIFADECPYLGLYTSSDVYAVSDKFTYDPSPMFWYNFSYADVHVAK